MTQRYSRFILVGLMALAPALGGAEGGCSPGIIPIGEDPGAAGAAGNPETPVACGDVTCAEGQVCCNPSCGICTPPGGACTTQLCGESSCTDTMADIRTVLAENQRCQTDADCTTVYLSCLPGESCTGGFPANRNLDPRTLAELNRDLNSCVNGDPDLGCPVCLRLDPPPVCSGGVCQAPTAPTEPPNSGPRPCDGKACGEGCSNCVDGQPCRLILESCDANGECGGPAACR